VRRVPGRAREARGDRAEVAHHRGVDRDLGHRDHRTERPGEDDLAGRNGEPRSRQVRASHSTASTGSPRQAAPVPLLIVAPESSASVISTPRRSRSPSLVVVSPSTNSPLDALSATVSANVMSQPAIRLSTISSAGTTSSTAARTVPASRSAASRSADRTNAISASILGCISRVESTTAPAATRMSSKSTPKSGWSTPSCRCTANDVNPIFRPTMRRPLRRASSVYRVWTA
jgi:hypothetical protein